MKNLRRLATAAFLGLLTPNLAAAQDVLGTDVVSRIADACGTEYKTYRDGAYPVGINTYGAACIETTRDEINSFFEDKVPSGLLSSTRGSAISIGAAWADLKGRCDRALKHVDPHEAATMGASDQKADGSYTGPFYTALNAFQSCLSGIQASQATFGYPMPVNDFNFLAGHVICMNDDGKYPNSSQQSKTLCPQIEYTFKRVRGFENI